jgi:hypothetical protein
MRVCDCVFGCVCVRVRVRVCVRVCVPPGWQVWSKPLSGGAAAINIVNFDSNPATVTCDATCMKAAGFPNGVRVCAWGGWLPCVCAWTPCLSPPSLLLPCCLHASCRFGMGARQPPSR